MSRFGIGIEMGYKYNRDKNYTIALNQATGEIDYAYSGDYIKNNRTTSVGMNIAKTTTNATIADKIFLDIMSTPFSGIFPLKKFVG